MAAYLAPRLRISCPFLYFAFCDIGFWDAYSEVFSSLLSSLLLAPCLLSRRLSRAASAALAVSASASSRVIMVHAGARTPT